jgi:general secretion pathway protein A
MVLDYYNLREQPFGGTPDSRFLFLTETHQEALASLLYGVEAGCGFLALIATPGLGKTTLLFHLSNLLREQARMVFLFQTICTPLDLLRALLTGLGVRETQGSLIEMQLRLKDLLAEQYRLGKRVVVVIDEAQNLDDSVLELVRMLSNFETARDKLIQIILSGQPQLADKIGSPELVQLRQRVSIFAGLKPFSAEDTARYIGHRLRTAGYVSDVPLFTKDALALIAQSSEGVPRIINNLCFNALSLGCALRQKLIDANVVREVIADLDLKPWQKKTSLPAPPEEKGALEVPAFLSAASARSMFAGWLPKVAVASVVLLALGGVLFESHRLPGLAAAAQPAPTAALQPSPTAALQPSPTAAAQPSPTAAAQPDSTAAVQPDEEPPLAPVAPSSFGADRSPQPAASASTIHVTPGQTLLGICVENFGSCTPELLREIHELNPRLSNPDHIESGQSIRIPVSGVTQSVVVQPDRASLAEKSMHD